MRKLLLLFMGFSAYACIAQDFTSRTPENVFGVVHYSGKILNNALPISKLDKYGIVRSDFFKALNLDTVHSLEGSGIDFSSDLLQYAVTRDTVLGFITLFKIRNQADFLKLVDANYGAELRPLKRDGYEIVYLSDNSSISWNGNHGVFVAGKFLGKRPNYYVDQETAVDTASVMIEEIDSVDVTTPEIDEKSGNDSSQLKDEGKQQQKEKTGKLNKVEKQKKQHVQEAAPPEIKDEEIMPDSTNLTPYIESDNDLYLQWEKKQDSIAKIHVRAFTENITSGQFGEKYPGVNNIPGYEKITDPAAAISVWLSTTNIYKMYWGFFMAKTLFPYKDIAELLNTPVNQEEGICTGTNIYFQKDRVHTVTRSYTASKELKEEMKALYKNRQGKSVAGFINPDNLGYVSFSFNSEAAIRSYYSQLKKYFSNYQETREYSDIINLYIDLMEIVIDEKAISELFPGNYLMVLHGLSAKKVNYTTYEYDSNFEYKEIQKVKDEPSPDFSFVMDTHRADFVQKALELPLKYAERNHFVYLKHDDYFEFKFEEGKSIFSSLYFMMADGRLVVTTNLEVITKVMHGQPFVADRETTKKIASNNFSAQFDLQGMLRAFAPQVNDEAGKKLITYLSENLHAVTANTSYRKGELYAEADLNLSDHFENSLSGIFEMIEKVSEIKRNAEMDAENKIN